MLAHKAVTQIQTQTNIRSSDGRIARYQSGRMFCPQCDSVDSAVRHVRNTARVAKCSAACRDRMSVRITFPAVLILVLVLVHARFLCVST